MLDISTEHAGNFCSLVAAVPGNWHHKCPHYDLFVFCLFRHTYSFHSFCVVNDSLEGSIWLFSAKVGTCFGYSVFLPFCYCGAKHDLRTDGFGG